MPQITITKVNINLTDNTVDHDPAILRKSNADEVQWSSTYDNATVIFKDLDQTQPRHNGTPFKKGQTV